MALYKVYLTGHFSNEFDVEFEPDEDGFIDEFDGVSVIFDPLFVNVLMVASSPGMPATTMSPLFAVDC